MKIDDSIKQAIEHGVHMRKTGYRKGYLDALHDLTAEMCKPDITDLCQALQAITKYTSNIDKIIEGKDYE